MSSGQLALFADGNYGDEDEDHVQARRGQSYSRDPLGKVQNQIVHDPFRIFHIDLNLARISFAASTHPGKIEIGLDQERARRKDAGSLLHGLGEAHDIGERSRALRRTHDPAWDGGGHQQRHDVRATIPQTGQHSPDDAVRRLQDLVAPGAAPSVRSRPGR